MNNGMDFNEWMNQVDNWVESIAFLSVYDLPDYMFRDSYESGCTPHEIAVAVLESANYPIELL